MTAVLTLRRLQRTTALSLSVLCNANHHNSIPTDFSRLRDIPCSFCLGSLGSETFAATPAASRALHPPFPPLHELHTTSFAIHTSRITLLATQQIDTARHQVEIHIQLEPFQPARADRHKSHFDSEDLAIPPEQVVVALVHLLGRGTRELGPCLEG